MALGLVKPPLKLPVQELETALVAVVVPTSPPPTSYTPGAASTEELNFESSSELGNKALNEFWDLWDIQRELQDLIVVENSKEKSVVEHPD